MRKYSLLPLLPLLLIALLMACAPSVPKRFIQPGDMEDILYDYHVAQAMAKAERAGDDTKFDQTKYFYGVLKKYGVTKEDFDSSMIYYYSHVERLKDIYTSVNERLSDEAKSLGTSVGDINRYSQFSASGDTANVWTGATDLLLMPYPTMNRYDFTLSVDTSYYKGDSFMFQFMTEYIYQSGSRDAVICIAAKYEGDSIIQTVNHVSISGLAQVRLPANNEKKLKELHGFIYLNSSSNDDATTRKMMFISQMQFIRFHNKPSANETGNNKNAKDSLSRTDNAGRSASDSLRRGNFERLHGKPLPAPPGNP
jgi:hypothetical protein